MTTVARSTVVVLGILALTAVFWQARAVLLATFLGLFSRCGHKPLIARLVRWRLSRGLAVTAVMVAILAFIALFLTIALRPAITEFGQLLSALPGLFDRLPALSGLADHAHRFLNRLPGLIVSSADLVLGILGGIAGLVLSAVTMFVLTVYFMLAFSRLLSTLERTLGQPERVEVARRALERIGGYLTGQITICICAGIAAFLELAGVAYAALLALTVTCFDVIPQVGATAAAVICVLVALTSSPELAIATGIFFIAYQQFENLILAPRVFSRFVSLSTTAVFLSVLLGLAIGGVLGAILARPAPQASK